MIGLTIGAAIIALAVGLELSVLQGGLLFLALMSAAVSVGVLSLGFTSFKKRVLLDLDTQKARFASVNVDALTGALVRSYFLTQLQALMKQAHIEPVGYVQIDMDHFKGLNDGNGHAVGDAALAYLVAQVRDVLPQALVGRLGGDEFGVAVIGCSSGAALKTICDEIRVALAKPVWLCGHYVRLGASMGIALAPAHADRVDDLISKADLALYKCKNQGRNSVVVFEEDMHRDERHRRFIERELRAAILVNQLELYYQPIYSTDGKTLRSYESLVRWQHPVRGTITPDDFIHIAEKSDLIDKLGDWVLRRACADIKALKAPKIAVNVSAAQLKRTDFAARFTAILEETGTAGNLLTVEITETVPLVAEGREKARLRTH